MFSQSSNRDPASPLSLSSILDEYLMVPSSSQLLCDAPATEGYAYGQSGGVIQTCVDDIANEATLNDLYNILCE